MWQLIYTSAPSGLVPGRSGFSTVARHRAISERLVAALERASVYEPAADGARPTIFSFRLITLTSDTYGVITRYCDAGLDYTSRRNYLAHHLVFTSSEMASLPPPAEVARRWTAWVTTWKGAPQWLPEEPAATAKIAIRKTALPADTWKKSTGDAGCAASLCPDGKPVEILFAAPAGADTDTLLALFAESSLLVRGGPWTAGFSTQAQPTDIPSQTPWRFTVGKGGTSPGQPPPDTETVRYARSGLLLRKQQRPVESAPAYVPAAESGEQQAAPVLRGETHGTPEGEQLPAAESGIAAGDEPARDRRSSLLFVFIGIFILILGGGVGIWLVNQPGASQSDSSVPANTPSAAANPEEPNAISTEQLQKIHAAQSVLRELDAARSVPDWSAAADAWKKLHDIDPELAAQRQADYLPYIQSNLAAALATALERQFESLAPQFPLDAVTACRKAVKEARGKIEAANARQPVATQTRFARLDAQLDFLALLPPPPPSMAFLRWNQSETSADRYALFSYKPLLAFLGNAQNSITLTLAFVDSWNEIASAPVPVPILEGDLDSGKKVLFIRPDTKGAPRIRLKEEKGRLRLEHTPAPGTQPDFPVETLFASGRSLNFTLVGNHTAPPKLNKKGSRPPASVAAQQEKTTVSLLLLSPDSLPPPLKASRSLLEFDQTKDSLAIPAWMRTALERFKINSTAQLVLYPLSDTDVAAQYTDPAVTHSSILGVLSRSQQQHHLQVEKFMAEINALEKKRTSASDTKTIDAALDDWQAKHKAAWQYEEALKLRQKKFNDSVSTPLVERGKGWVAAYISRPDDIPLPLVIFE
ncbi:MAG: hypothetical protein LBV54_06050 [Puniceicoccales bacterium]|jgi:hypothetical protein|nr:hypothetical protein [Puniceicoccales bacterium]